MYKAAIAALVLVMLSGCGQIERMGARLTGHSEHCIDGVKYIQFASGATVKYNPDGTIETCGKFKQ